MLAATSVKEYNVTYLIEGSDSIDLLHFSTSLIRVGQIRIRQPHIIGNWSENLKIVPKGRTSPRTNGRRGLSEITLDVSKQPILERMQVLAVNYI